MQLVNPAGSEIDENANQNGVAACICSTGSEKTMMSGSCKGCFCQCDGNDENKAANKSMASGIDTIQYIVHYKLLRRT